MPVQAADSETMRRSADDPGAVPGDAYAARERVAAAAGDNAAMLPLRQAALALADGTDWSRVDDQAVLDLISAAMAQGRLPSGAARRPQLRRLVSAEPLVSPPPPPPAAASAPRAAAAAPPPAAEATFGSDLDVQAMVAVLVQAAQDGVPFCEECARAAAAAATA